MFTYLDWLVVVAYFAVTTWIGTVMAGRQATFRDFFLAGRKLPWYAVAGSIISTEISAVTFVSVPWLVFKPGGNITYLQTGLIGAMLARVIVGYFLVPRYYEREIYSPYDYMANELGREVRGMVTALFTVGTLLAQAVRLFITGQVLIVLMPTELGWLTQNLGLDPLAWAILMLGIVSVAWALIGGMATVVWTDVLLFACFLVGAAILLVVAISNLDGGVGEFLRVGAAADGCGPSLAPPAFDWGKFTLFDFNPSPFRDFTIWTAVFAITWGSLNAYGTDQLLVQRLFCCRSPRDARWAIISSGASQVVTIMVAMIGVALYVFYQSHAMPANAQRSFAENGERLLPIFVVTEIPIGLRGLIIAAIFAAAVASSVLVALSQTSVSLFYRGADERRGYVFGRFFVVVWGLALCAVAYWVKELDNEKNRTILQLALAMASYIGGALLGGVALAFFRLPINGYGYLFSAPLSAMCIFALAWHQPWAWWICCVAAGLLLAAWFYFMPREMQHRVRKTLILLGGVVFMLALNRFGFVAVEQDGDTRNLTLAWPWWTPLGSLVAFAWGYWLAGQKPADMRIQSSASQ